MIVMSLMTESSDTDYVAEALIAEIQDAYEALEDTHDLDWTSFERLLDKAIAYGGTNVDDGDFEFRIFKNKTQPLSVLSKQLSVLPVYAWYCGLQPFDAIALHQVVDRIAEMPFSGYTFEHVKLLCETYPEGIDKEGSILDLLFRNRRHTVYSTHLFQNVLVCANWFVDQKPKLLWQGDNSTWDRMCAYIGRGIRDLRPENDNNRHTGDGSALLKIMQENFGPIVKVYCKEMCINWELCLRQLGDHSLQQYMLTNHRVLSDGSQFSFENVLGSSRYGEDTVFWSLVIASQPKSLSTRSNKNGLHLFAVAAAENRSVDVIFYLLSADPAALMCSMPFDRSSATKRKRSE